MMEEELRYSRAVGMRNGGPQPPLLLLLPIAKSLLLLFYIAMISTIFLHNILTRVNRFVSSVAEVRMSILF
jgi:hypothetical protein